ncbi:MAG: hypothetical protein J3Q66DRAFT_325049 [Benniella sp.]|nr:MAG: hypothetical protein J3Q66DRAFT_325049 [Benniella sp.]
MIDANPTQAASLKKVLADGHMLASHTYTHEKSLTAMTAAELTSEITRTSDTMFKHSGVKPAYVRAPRGECDQQCINRLTAMNLVVSHWNCDTNDWRQMDMAKKNPQQAATVSMEEPTKSIINGSNPATDSFILLQHEIHEFSVDILANMVAEAITKKGYRFVTMEECIGVPAYLDGSTVPPPTTPPTVTSPAVVPPPVGATTAPGAVVPTASVGTPQVTVQPPKPSGNSTAGAGIVKAGAWAMGLAAAVGYAFL